MVATERRRAGRGEHADAGARRADPARWDEPRERGRRASARAPRGSNARAKRGGGEEGAPSAMAAAQLPVPMRRAHAGQHNTLGQQPTSASRRCARTQSEEIEISKKERLRRGFGVTRFARNASAGRYQRRRQKRKTKQNPSLSNEKTRENRAREHTLPPRLSDGPSWPPSPRHRRARRLPRSTPRPAFASRAGSRRARAADIRARAAFPRSPPRAHHRHPPT